MRKLSLVCRQRLLQVVQKKHVKPRVIRYERHLRTVAYANDLAKTAGVAKLTNVFQFQWTSSDSLEDKRMRRVKTNEAS